MDRNKDIFWSLCMHTGVADSYHPTITPNMITHYNVSAYSYIDLIYMHSSILVFSMLATEWTPAARTLLDTILSPEMVDKNIKQ